MFSLPKQFLRSILIGFACLVAHSPSFAHQSSASYLSLEVTNLLVNGRIDVALKDLEPALHLDTDQDGQITWEELQAAETRIHTYLEPKLSISLDGDKRPMVWSEMLVDHHQDGTYAVLLFEVTAAARPQKLAVDYQVLFELDPTHRGLFQLLVGTNTITSVFNPQSHLLEFELEKPNSPRDVFLRFGREGIHHIWTGYDHLLFLLMLLLPSVLIRDGKGWQPVDRLKPALIETTKIVTAFTVAHSITLTLAALGKVNISSRIIEPAIAASIILTALNNIRPMLDRREWMVAFGFGLIHGFGFAGALAEMELPTNALAVSLFSFNAGVEVGQMAVVALVVPGIYMARTRPWYLRYILRGGSLAGIYLAAIWFAERVGNFKVLPF